MASKEGEGGGKAGAPQVGCAADDYRTGAIPRLSREKNGGKERRGFRRGLICGGPSIKGRAGRSENAKFWDEKVRKEWKEKGPDAHLSHHHPFLYSFLSGEVSTHWHVSPASGQQESYPAPKETNTQDCVL